MRRLLAATFVLSLFGLGAAGCESAGSEAPRSLAGLPSAPVDVPLLAAVAPAGEPAAAGGATERQGPTACPAGQVLAQGEYCTDVRHTCKRWLDDSKLPYARCAEYEPKAECIGKRVHLSFCIDREEYTPPGEELPMNWSSFNGASRVCKERGMRICTESEWNFACEGEEMRPYPYGWERKAVCNQDREDLYIQTPKKQLLKDHRQPASANPECLSPFGVHNMAGNVDEPVLREEARFNPPFRNALKGGWWMAARNRCRPATTAHDDYYNDIQVGVRCCSDVAGESGAKG